MNGHLKQQVYAASLAVYQSTKYDGLMFLTTNGFVFGTLDDKVQYQTEHNVIRLKNAHISTQTVNKVLFTNQISINLEFVIAVYPIHVQEELDHINQ